MLEQQTSNFHRLDCGTMPEYKHPGVYLEAVPSEVSPIERVPTDVAGAVARTDLVWLVGFAPLRPAESVVLRMAKRLRS